MMQLRKAATVLLAISALAACSRNDDNQQQAQAYVSPLQFKKYSCKQIAKEMAYTSSQYEQATKTSDIGRVLDTGLAVYGISRGFAYGTDDSSDQVDYLKSKMDALHQAAIEKDCD